MFKCESVKYELLSDKNGVKTWQVDIIHPSITRNNREYTKPELQAAARSWSFRPLNINHDESRWLPYNWKNPIASDSNSTLEMDYVETSDAVSGKIQVIDADTNGKLERKEIAKLSIEQFPSKGESCSCQRTGSMDSCKCTQHGIIGTALALLETYRGVEPGDPETKIKPEAVKEECVCLEKQFMKWAEEYLKSKNLS